jgi:DNA primase
VTVEVDGYPLWRFGSSISIPYFDGRGREVAIRFRTFNGKHKYDQRSDVRLTLYGLDLRDEPVVYLTEGEFDALILRQLGLPGIGVPGANAWKSHWRYLFRDADRVVICFDGDDAGRREASKIARSLRGVTNPVVVQMPDTKHSRGHPADRRPRGHSRRRDRGRSRGDDL